MKKISTILLCLVVLTSCSPEHPAASSSLPESGNALSVAPDVSAAVGSEITDCGAYEWAKGAQSSDETGIRRFLGLCQDRTPARVRIVFYTVEGDPISYDISFDGAVYTCTKDTTADAFGPQEITTRTWNYLIRQEFVCTAYDDGSPRDVRVCWTLSDVTVEEIEAHPLAEYDGLLIFEENIQYR